MSYWVPNMHGYFNYYYGPQICNIKECRMCVLFEICRSAESSGGGKGPPDAHLQQNMENHAAQQQQQFYATLHKEKVPESAEDISPYATFHLADTARAHTPRRALPGPPHLLHSFVYHEQPTTEGCASPPSLAVTQNYIIYSDIPLFYRGTHSG